ncbi:A/G-specific adenine glycosylase [Cohnella sp. AR92]|uniref:A/G-specific adenine glycosylase n=1 Tax=Cohnella sp. AR92 TaxID=648716 RepID=UPI000F8E4DE0|nr:A/G-specific adenine glycosylase [Cohnella sp. AR92]RUS46613.1 A/G-specific adenine glycosylase [Cohnella sp. AR92]
MYETEAAKVFSEELVAWYRRGNRDLPWRRTKNPYYIWISEIMLQQTRVDTVIPYFNRFVERFPTVRDLAEAPEEDVLKLWEGLGYYSRARNLQAAAREIADNYGGMIPADKTVVSGLKGVGPYTSGAILSIAFNLPEPAVDGNVMRVLSRYFCLEDDIAKPATRVGIEGLARELIPEGAAGDFNQALMELGALVCTPRSPHCLTCPVMEHCAARLAGRQEELPIKTKAKKPKPQHRLAVLIEDSEGRVLARQRPEQGLLAKLWELPHIEAPFEAWSSQDAAPEWLKTTLSLEGMDVRTTEYLGSAEHVFSHLHWFVRIWGADRVSFDGSVRDDMDQVVQESAAANEAGAGAAAGAEAGVGAEEGIRAEAIVAAEAGTSAKELPDGYRWIDLEQFEKLAWPNLFRSILSEHFASK